MAAKKQTPQLTLSLFWGGSFCFVNTAMQGLPVFTLAALSTAAAYLVYVRLLAAAGAKGQSLIAFLIPVCATLLGMVFFTIHRSPQHIAGFS